MSLGYAAARNTKRPLQETGAAFIWWAAMFAILGILMAFPTLLVNAIRVGIAAAVIYFIWSVGHWIYYSFSGLPRMQRIKRKHIRLACSKMDRNRASDMKTAAREALKYYSKPIVLNALAVAALDEKMGKEAIDRQCRNAADKTGEIVERLRNITGKARRGDQRFIETLTLCCGADSVEQALSDIEKESGKGGRSALMNLARRRTRNRDRAKWLRSIGVEAPLPAKDPETDGMAIDAGNLIIGFLCPLCIFIFTKRRGHALAYGASYFALLVYATILFGIGDGRAWVFLAVLGLIHLTAFFNAGIDWAIESNTN